MGAGLAETGRAACWGAEAGLNAQLWGMLWVRAQGTYKTAVATLPDS